MHLETIRYLIRIAQIAKDTNLPAQVWEQRRTQRLRRLVQRAHQHSLLCRNHWGLADARDIRLSDLRPVCKADLVGRLEEHMTARPFSAQAVGAFLDDPTNLGAWFCGHYCVYRTSGTQGSSLTIVQDRWTVRTVFACVAARSRGARRPSVFEFFKLIRQPKRVAFITAKAGFFPSSATVHLLPRMTGRLIKLGVFSIMDPGICDQLARFQPHAVFGYAGSLDFLARSGAVFGPQLEQINNSSEQLISSIRQRLETTYRVPVLDHYGTGECLQLADVCPAGRMHINADWAILEPVDDQLRPIPVGSISSKVLVTNLANTLQPFVRYVVDDRVSISPDESCACGSSFPILQALHGRSSDQIVVRSSTGQTIALPGILFQNVTDQYANIVQWRVVQTAGDALVIEWQLAEPHPGDQSGDQSGMCTSVTNQLYQQGLPEFVQLQFRPLTHSIIDSVSGKSKRIVPLPPN